MLLRNIIVCILMMFQATAFANGFNLHIARGLGFPHFSNTDSIYLNPFVENTYKMSNDTWSDFILNFGGGYQWSIPKYPFAVSLNISGFYMTYNVPGTVFPFVNIGQFDTLDFEATDGTWAILFEPKIIFTQYTFQPYLIFGIGRSWNRLSSYSETPSSPMSTSVPMSPPFSNKTLINTAYEIGIGLQTKLYQTTRLAYFNIFLDYRLMDLGKMQLGPSPTQTTTGGPYLGTLRAQAVSIGIEYQDA